MNLRGPHSRRASDSIEIINLKVMVHTCSTCSVPYYTISVGEKHQAKSNETRRALDHQVGRYMSSNLIEALTQDGVLEAISPCVKKPSVGKPLKVGALACLILLQGLYGPAMAQNQAPIRVNPAVLAIIGEAEGEGYQGMLAVACAIRNRGTLKGVYGLRAYRVTHHLYSGHTLTLAEEAWGASKQEDVTHGARGWGSASDLRSFQKHSWWSRCKITYHYKGHWFYKEAR